MALRGTYTRPSSCAGTFFPVARLVKIIASHSKRTPPLPHLGARATRAHSLGLLLQSSPGEEHMDILSTLRNERSRIAGQLNALETAIRALSGNTTHASHRPRRMSAAARARISASQKARWARARSQKVVSIAPKRRRISAAGLANIRAAQRARWAKTRRQK